MPNKKQGLANFTFAKPYIIFKFYFEQYSLFSYLCIIATNQFSSKSERSINLPRALRSAIAFCRRLRRVGAIH